MDGQGQSFDPMLRNDKAQRETGTRKKVYESPLLQAWGSILDLTRGNFLDFDDAPLFGGTRVA